MMEIYTPMWRNYRAEMGKNLKWTTGFLSTKGEIGMSKKDEVFVSKGVR